MKIPLDSAGSVILDLDRLIVSRGLLQANSGAGKSWALRRILEQSHGHIQQIVIDPEDEFYTLREKYEYILIRHEDGDGIPDVRSAELLAIRLLELGVSAIISLYELIPRQRREFVKLFLNAMVNAPKHLHHKCLVVIDEAHEFAPEAGKGGKQKRDESGGCVDAVIGLMSKGRKRGFCGFLATQRISKLNKDAAAEANTKFIGRCTLDVDRERAGVELGMTTAAEKLTLRTIEPGNFFCFGPAISDDILPVRFGGVKTTHPEAGAQPTPVAPPKSKVKAVLSKLADIPKEAEQERATVASLQQKIRELQSQPRVTATEVSEYSKIIERLERELAEKAKPETVEVPILTPTEIKQMKNSDAAVAKQLARVAGALEAVTNILPQILELQKKRDERMTAIENLLTTKPLSRVAPVPAPTPRLKQEAVGARGGTNAATAAGPRTAANVEPRGDTGDFYLNKKQQEILDALAWYESIGIKQPKLVQVGAVALIDPTGGYFSNLVGPLATNGLVNRSGGTLSLTQIGRAMANIPEQARSLSDYHDVLRQRVRKMKSSSGKTIDILNSIIGRAGDMGTEAEISNVEIGEDVKVDVSGGYFSNSIGPLSTAGLITRGGGIVRPTEVLFPPGIS